jgi:hypothetical protein
MHAFSGKILNSKHEILNEEKEEEEDRVGRFDPQAGRGWRFGEFTGRDTP